MADPKVVQYVKENLQHGCGIEEIKSSLRQSGWPEDVIIKGIQEVTGTQPVPGPVAAPSPGTGTAEAGKEEPRKKKGRKMLILALVILAIVIILFLFSVANTVNIFSDMFPGSWDYIQDLVNPGG
jgi:hypothetical protein